MIKIELTPEKGKKNRQKISWTSYTVRHLDTGRLKLKPMKIDNNNEFPVVSSANQLKAIRKPWLKW